jgi:predicted alpha/beta hydrolase family esterase
MIALAETDRFSIVTIAGTNRAAPLWETMFGWPAAGGQALPLVADTVAERDRWAARLDAIVRQGDRAVLLIADGAGCAASAWWARLSPAGDVARIAGAVLFAPKPDGPAPDRPRGLFDSPRIPLPFPSLVIQPGNEAAQALPGTIDSWGSRLVIGDRHRDRTAGVAWRQAQRLFVRMTGHIVEQEVERARALADRR